MLPLKPRPLPRPQILQQQQGQFPATPDREELFEPQHNDDTKTTPTRPTIPPPQARTSLVAMTTRVIAAYTVLPQSHLLETTDMGVEGATPPRLRVTRPSLASSGSEAGSLHSGLDDDFARLAKARSNPDILRSTLDQSDIRGESTQGWGWGYDIRGESTQGWGWGYDIRGESTQGLGWGYAPLQQASEVQNLVWLVN